MADVKGAIGYNSPAGTNLLLAAFGNDVINVSTGLGYNLNLTADRETFFETFIDCVFMTNGVDKMRVLVGGAWNDAFSLPKQIVPKYIKKSVNNAQLLIANCILTPGSGSALNYKSYVFKSNFPKLGKSLSGAAIAQSIQWGIESGRCDLKQNTRQLKAKPDGNGRLPYFITRGIKVGDPVFILGGDIGQYTVASVDSEYELTLNEKIPSADAVNTNLDFWVGSNFFPVGTDDNDEIRGFGENSSRDLIFKLFSLWYYTGAELRQVKGAPGTSSQRSVINDRKGNTYYFHGSDNEKTGIYRYDGTTSVKISRAVDAFIQGMSAANYDNVVAWEEGDELRFFIGDITNNDEDISMTNAVVTLNTATNAFDVTPIKDVITCATTWIESNTQSSYCGNSEGQVLKMNSGNDYNGDPIAAILETGVKYPSGSQLQNTYPYVEVVTKNARGLKLLYQLVNAPFGRDDRWSPLGEIEDDKSEFQPDIKHRVSSGIRIRVEDNGALDNNWLVEQISIYYKPERARNE